MDRYAFIRHNELKLTRSLNICMTIMQCMFWFVRLWKTPRTVYLWYCKTFDPYVWVFISDIIYSFAKTYNELTKITSQVGLPE